MKKVLKHLIVSSIVLGFLLFASYYYFPELGFVVESNYNVFVTFFVLGFVFYLFNSVVKKIVDILSLPLKILTLGIFSFFVNVVVFYLFKIFVNNVNIGIKIQLTNFIGVLILSFLITSIYWIIKKVFI